MPCLASFQHIQAKVPGRSVEDIINGVVDVFVAREFVVNLYNKFINPVVITDTIVEFSQYILSGAPNISP